MKLHLLSSFIIIRPYYHKYIYTKIYPAHCTDYDELEQINNSIVDISWCGVFHQIHLFTYKELVKNYNLIIPPPKSCLDTYSIKNGFRGLTKILRYFATYNYNNRRYTKL